MPAQVTARPPTKREQREASVEKLLAAALHLFVSQGYRHTSVEQIADEAGLTKGAVYFYFKNKETLLLTLLDKVEEIVVERMVERVSAAQPNATDKLVAFIHGQAALGVEAWEWVLLLILMSLEFGGQDDPIAARTKVIYDRMYRTVEHILALGRQRGEFVDTIGIKEQAAVVVAGHDGTFLEWYRRSKEFDGEELVRALRVATVAGVVRHTRTEGDTTE
jgi:AcrR family transcriptional regulator